MVRWTTTPNVKTMSIFLTEYLSEPTVLNASIDTLVLSCHTYRQGNNPQFGLEFYIKKSNLSTDFVEDCDREMADDIRKYYGHKISMQILSQKPISKFRNDLRVFLLSDGKTITTDVVGMISRLPAFYHYDKTLEKLAENFSFQTPKNLQGELELQFLKSIPRVSRGVKCEDFWFLSTSTKYPVLITINNQNTLFDLWQKYLKVNQTIVISGRFIVRKDRDINYLSPSKWSVVKI